MPSPPRSLADDLRDRPAAELVALLQARPDLADPLPVDLASLAARAGTRASVHRALSDLDAPTLAVATVLTLLEPPIGVAELAGACATTPQRVRPILRRLRELGLVFGGPRSNQPVRALADVLGPYPAALGPPIAELLAGAPARLAGVCATLGLPADVQELATHLRQHARDLLDAGPPRCAEVLERVGDIPVGTVSRADRDLDPDSRQPLDWLLARALLVPLGPDQVVIPREAGIGIRGHVLALPQPPAPPTPPPGSDGGSRTDPDRVAPAAAGELVRLTGDLLATLQAGGAAILRNGGLSARDLSRLTRGLQTTPEHCALVIVAAAGAGLIGIADDPEHGSSPRLRPTATAADWAAGSIGERWAALTAGWLAAPWSASLFGERDQNGGLLAALSPQTMRPLETRLRRQTMQVLTDAAAPADPEGVLATLRYRAPRGPVAALARLVPTILAQAHLLGLLAFGRAAGYARPLVADDLAEAAAGLDALLPAPVPTVLIQADLTAVAPGPLTWSTAAVMELAAEVESRGAATVFRFTKASIGRALDSGQSPGALLETLREVSSTPLPQPLEYLVRDTARRHGVVRIGEAGSYLHCEDEQLLRELLADPRMARVGLRLLAATVAVSPCGPSRLLEAVQSSGVAAAQELPDGSIVTAATRRRPAAVGFAIETDRPRTLDDQRAGEIVDLLLHVERLRTTAPSEQAPTTAGPGRGQPPSDDIADTLRQLSAAAGDRRPVWVSVSDGNGRQRTMKVQLLRVGAGSTQAMDTGTGRTMTIPIHRIAAVTQA